MNAVPLPQSVTVEGNRVLYPRAALLEYGMARAEAAYRAGYQAAIDDQSRTHTAQAKYGAKDVNELFGRMGMKP